MRKSLIVGALAAFAAGGALAQAETPAAKSGPQNSAVNSSDKPMTGPVEGANSFTEGEAKSRIEKMGFTNVGNLKKDDNGIWRGRAAKNGKQVEVALDYQGNVVTGNAAVQGSTAGTAAPAKGSAGR